jgi:hypothetical protein
MDLVQLASLTTMQSITTTALPTVDGMYLTRIDFRRLLLTPLPLVAARKVSKLPPNHSLSDSAV